MQKLPQEIINNISEYVVGQDDDRSRVAGLATISRAWQRAIEQDTFRELSVESSDFDVLSSALCSDHGVHRPSLIKTLRASILLPEYPIEARAVHETNKDRALNNEAASEGTSYLLRILSAAHWPDKHELELVLRFYSPTDDPHKKEQRVFDATKDIGTERYDYSWLSLSDLDYKIPCVTKFSPETWRERSLDPKSLMGLTAAFANLKCFDWPRIELGFFAGRNRQLLKELTDALADYQLGPQTERITVHVVSPRHPRTDRVPNLIDDAPSSSSGSTGRSRSFCDAIRTMIGGCRSRQIEWMIYKGPVEPELFWPSHGDNDDGAADSSGDSGQGWSVMERLAVHFEMASFSGQWFFKGYPGDGWYDESNEVPLPPETTSMLPPGYGSAEDTQAAIDFIEAKIHGRLGSRSVPRDEALNPMLAAWARRLATMASLKTGIIRAVDTFHGRKWLIEYLAPGIESPYDKYVASPHGVRSPRFFFHTEGWKPSADVMRLLQNVGTVLHGQDVAIEFLPLQFDQSLSITRLFF